MSERSWEWYDRMRFFCTSPTCDDFCTHTFDDDTERDDDCDDEPAPTAGEGTGEP